MNQTLYVMQGASGSGKSTISEMICRSLPKCVICSTDDLFWEGTKYNFRFEKLAEYHAINLERTKVALDDGYDVIVDNTNIMRWQCRKYVEYAVSKGIAVVFIRVNGQFKNVHGVGDDKVQQMRDSMENLTVESVLAS